MEVYNFTEMSYYPAWSSQEAALRISFPNREFDPTIGHQLYNRYLDEHLLADELGMNIMINEHHSSATCLSASAPISLAALARQTKKARLLVLGNPVGHRPDPVRLAEELAMIDVISGGRLEAGFVRATPAEVAPANSNPATLTERYWEAVELIERAWTSHDGPFNWEGDFFHYRKVNIWPRPYQQPKPPIWLASGTPEYGQIAADRNATLATFFSGPVKTREIFSNYRQRCVETGKPIPDPRRFAYLAMVAVGHTEEQGLARIAKVMEFLRTLGRTYKAFNNPPGFLPTTAGVTALRGSGGPFAFTSRSGERVPAAGASLEQLSDAGMVFAGTPDQVYNQIADFNRFIGGCGNLVMMAQGGSLSHEETCDSLKLFAKEVLPRLREEPMRAAS